MENWKNITESNNLYAVSDKGRIRNNKTNKIMKSIPYKNGYLGVGLMIDGKQKKFRIHRLVGEYFVPNPNNLPQINHKDENKINNNALNLEWCTAKYNICYGSKIKRTIDKISKKIFCTELNKGYPSVSEAARGMAVNESSIRKACDNKNKTCAGFHWISI